MTSESPNNLGNSEQSPGSQYFDLVHFKHPDRFGQWLGYDIQKVDKKAFATEATLTLREDHLSPAGRVHGGVISAFLDFACGSAVFTTMSKNELCSTVEIKVNYLRPLVLGDSLLAQTRVVFRGKKICVVHALVFRKNDLEKPVAMATATFNVLSGDSQ